MKHIASILVLILTVFTGSTAFAQKFHAGFSLGLDASTINGANVNNHLRKVGVIAGGIANTEIGEKSIFQFELNFIQKGSLQPPDSLNNGYNKIALQYIEIPVMIRRRLKFNVRKKPMTRFEIEGGISVARLIGITLINNQNAQLPSEGQFNKFEAGLLLGINYNISKNVYFNLRYSNSVIPAVKRNPLNYNFITYTYNRGNNQVLQFCFKFVLHGVGEKSAAPSDVDGN